MEGYNQKSNRERQMSPIMYGRMPAMDDESIGINKGTIKEAWKPDSVQNVQVLIRPDNMPRTGIAVVFLQQESFSC